MKQVFRSILFGLIIIVLLPFLLILGLLCGIGSLIITTIDIPVSAISVLMQRYLN